MPFSFSSTGRSPRLSSLRATARRPTNSVRRLRRHRRAGQDRRPAALRAGQFCRRTAATKDRRSTPLITKAINARNHGAKAVVVVNGKLDNGEAGQLTRFGSVSGPENAGIILVQVKNDVAQPGLPQRGSRWPRCRSRSTRRQARVLRVSGFVHLASTSASRRARTVNNVLAYLPGKTDDTSSSARTTIISATATTIRWRPRRSARFIPARTTTLPAPPGCWNWRACSRRSKASSNAASCSCLSRAKNSGCSARPNG